MSEKPTQYNRSFFLQLARQGEEKWNAWREENPEICIDFHGVDFIVNMPEVSFRNFHFGDRVNFNSTVFGDRADFYNATFGVGVDFSGAMFGNEADFSRTTFGDGVDFDSATFGDRATFHSALFTDKAKFCYTIFGDRAKFYSVKFGHQADFISATFGDGAEFNSVEFGDRAAFNVTTFGDWADFNGAIFGDRASFSWAIFRESADFSNAKFGKYADLKRVVFSDQAAFCYTTFGDRATFSVATFGDGAEFNSATFGDRADFNSASFGNCSSLTSVVLDGADFRRAKNIQLDETSIRHARFDNKATDHWSVLRRTYTGPRLAFTLIFLLLFIAPYAGKVAYWKAFNEYQGTPNTGTGTPLQSLNGLRPNDIRSQYSPNLAKHISISTTERTKCGRPSCMIYQVWQLALGANKENYVWVLAIGLIVFNLLKALITIFVIPMREQEERSGFSPNRYTLQTDPVRNILYASDLTTSKIKRVITNDVTWGYELFYILHKTVKLLFFVSITAFLFNAYDLLFSDVFISPPG